MKSTDDEPTSVGCCSWPNEAMDNHLSTSSIDALSHSQCLDGRGPQLSIKAMPISLVSFHTTILTRWVEVSTTDSALIVSHYKPGPPTDVHIWSRKTIHPELTMISERRTQQMRA